MQRFIIQPIRPLSLILVHSPPARIFSSPTTILDPTSQRSIRSLYSPHFLLSSKRGNLRFVLFFLFAPSLPFSLFSLLFLHFPHTHSRSICALILFHRPLIYIHHSHSTHTFSQCKVNFTVHLTLVTLQTLRTLQDSNGIESFVDGLSTIGAFKERLSL